MQELYQNLKQIVEDSVEKLVISKPNSSQERYHKIVVEKKEQKYQMTCYTEKQVFHENIAEAELYDALCHLIEGTYRQVNAWSAHWEHMLMLSKKGKCSYKRKQRTEGQQTKITKTHNRKKQYLLEEGTAIAPLVDMGIFTKEGTVVHAMYDKYKQINRFLEILDDAIDSLEQEEVSVIDFGCGKSYLTFVVYYYLTEQKGKRVRMLGLDLKEDVIKKCNAAAQKYGYDGLQFEMGDIQGYQAKFPVDIVITLHACDTATDYALYNAIQWRAKMIFSVPCCQHELNQQIRSEQFSLLTRYGILKERFSALATDAIRGNLLESCGYKTQLLEFIDFAHTPKNILIRAVRRSVSNKETEKKALKEVQALMKEFSFEPTLYHLLQQMSGVEGLQKEYYCEETECGKSR